MGLKVVTKDGIEGVIDSPFGKAGKFKVSFHQEHHLEKNDELYCTKKTTPNTTRIITQPVIYVYL